MLILSMLLIFVVLLLIGIPAFFSMGISSISYMAITRGIFSIPEFLVAQRTVYNLSSFTLLAIPLFIFMAKIMNESGVTDDLFGFAKAMVGHWKGGLGQVNILASVMFAGMSGSATADAAGLGAIEIKAMKDAGFPDDFACAITAASSLIGPIIPPSIPAVTYAILSGVSVSKLLIGGIIPGIILALSLGSIVYYQASKNNYPVEPRRNIPERLKAFKKAFLPMMTPFILIGGILTGVFTATEAAAVASLYALILAMLVYRSVSFRKLFKICKDTMLDSSVLMIILGISNVFSWILTRAQIPTAFASAIASISNNYFVVMALIIGFLLFLGLFFSSTVSIAITTTILMPVLSNIGADPIAFGIIMILTLMLGNLTPPFGMVLFATAKVGNIEFTNLVKALVPYYLPIIIVVVLLIIFPSIVTVLPNLL